MIDAIKNNRMSQITAAIMKAIAHPIQPHPKRMQIAPANLKEQAFPRIIPNRIEITSNTNTAVTSDAEIIVSLFLIQVI